MAGLLETLARHLGLRQEQRRTPRAVSRPKTVSANVVNSIQEPSGQTTGVYESKEDTIDRSIKRERAERTMDREDLLLTQIDEFRNKAQQLQSLLLSKESKVAELQNIVDEREGKAKELESILSERQRQADVITEEMTQHIDSLIVKVSAKMDEIGTSITASVNESVGRELTESRQLNEKQIAELQELRELLETINPQLEAVKSELTEKVHSENVKCYRNISDLFKSTEDKLEQIAEVQDKVASVKGCTVAIIVLSIINLLGLVALALYELGVFQSLLG